MIIFVADQALGLIGVLCVQAVGASAETVNAEAGEPEEVDDWEQLAD